MDRNELEILEKLVNLPGVPGRESQVADFICAYISSVCDCQLDNLGNVIAHFPGKGKRVMVVAHMDEVGFIVQRIMPEGFLKVERMGGASIRALPGSRLTLWTSQGSLSAVGGILPQHLDNNEPILDFSKIYIDIGSSSAEETYKMGVKVGDILTWDAPLSFLSNSLITGKALDDRLGCFCLLQLAHFVKTGDLLCDLYLVFSVQEELMLMGGKTATESIEPDVIIGIDGTLAFDTPDLQGKQADIRIGGGPALKWMDAIRGKLAAFVPNQVMANQIYEIAQKLSIPIQNEIVVGISTAITPMIYASKGARACALSIPIRYHHTPIEMAHLHDVENSVLLLKGLLMDSAQEFFTLE